MDPKQEHIEDSSRVEESLLSRREMLVYGDPAWCVDWEASGRVTAQEDRTRRLERPRAEPPGCGR